MGKVGGLAPHRRRTRVAGHGGAGRVPNVAPEGCRGRHVLYQGGARVLPRAVGRPGEALVASDSLGLPAGAARVLRSGRRGMVV